MESAKWKNGKKKKSNLGKPVFGAISDEYNLYLATLVWWGVFYSPADIFYKGNIH